MGNYNKKVDFDDITAWMAGEADEVTRTKIKEEIRNPDSPTRRHLAWQADPLKHQPSPETTDEAGFNQLPAFLKGWTPRLPIVLGSGFAAVLLFGIANLLYSQQSLKKQLVDQQRREQRAISEIESLKTEHGKAFKENAEIKLALAARERKLDELRRSLVNAEVSSRSLQEEISRLTHRVAEAEVTPAWPPNTLLLMGGSPATTEKAGGKGRRSQTPLDLTPIDFAILLRRKNAEQYFGIALPVGHSGTTTSVSARFDEKTSEIIVVNQDESVKNWDTIGAMVGPALVSPSDRPNMKPPVSPPFRIKLDRQSGTFTGTHGDSRLRGKLVY